MTIENIESGAYGISSTSIEQLPTTTHVLMGCEIGGWNICWPF